MLGYGGFLLLGGRAADLLGRRRMFLISLGVFIVASALGGFVDDGSLLIATRFIKGVSAAFTAPAGLSIITTSFAEGALRNKALSIYTATGATGFSLGLVVGGLLTEVGWRWVFLLPVPVALVVLIAAIRLVPDSAPPERGAPLVRPRRRGRASPPAMLLLVYTRGRGAGRGLGGRRARSSRSPARRRCSPSSSAVERGSASRWCGSASCARRPSCAPTSARWPCSGLGRLPVHRDPLHAAAAGLVAARDRARHLPGGLLVALLAPRIGALVARFGVGAADRGGLTSRPRRLRRSSCRSGSTRPTGRDPPDDAARRARLRPGLRPAEHRRDQRHRAGGAGPRRRAGEHLVPVRRGAGAGRGHGGGRRRGRPGRLAAAR